LHLPFLRNFETPEEVNDWVRAFNQSVPRHFWEISMDKQVSAFHEFFNWLVQK